MLCVLERDSKGAALKLVHPPLVSTEPTHSRRKADAHSSHSSKPVVPVEAVERTRAAGSYTSNAQGNLPGKFSQQHHQAIHSYLHTASLDEDGGELIGIDTYA